LRRRAPKDIGPGESATRGAIMLVTNIPEEAGKSAGSYGDGEMWFHADSCYYEVPNRATFLYALVLPKSGGNTKIASMYAAWDNVPAALKARIEGRRVLQVHDYKRRERLDHEIVEVRLGFPPVEREVAMPAPDERVGVEDHEGALVDEQTAFLLGDLMAGVVARGTGTAAKQIGRPAAGKTGTTNDNTDAWFVGYTGRVLAAVWLGHDDPRKTLGPRDDGAHAALPLWVTLVRLAEGARREQSVPGEAPAGLVRARVDRETGLLSAPGAGGGADVWFKQGTAPTEVAGEVGGTSADFGRTAKEF